ncbi:hypothetical protein BDF14DRAFT_1882133 [Spinellus fusiger]|nr:hypothetical protein BDF14DRAFT_1882133 [Spinellus fusiger]
MFKKPLSNLKTFSPLRSSDKRRFQNEAYDAYPHIKEKFSQEGVSQLIPDTLQSAKFTTHINTSGVVYLADKMPLWIKVDQSLPIPTVYTLWQYPDILPILYTWSPVVQKLSEGADLMIPGLVPGAEGVLPVLNTGDLVAITIKAVGTMALPTSQIKPRSGMKGKAVHILHVYQDHLWAMGDKSDPPGLNITLEEDEENQQDSVPQVKDSQQRPAPQINKEQDTTTNQQQTLSAQETDVLLKRALLQAFQFKITPERTSDLLPMLSSTLYASYILPCRPQATEVDIKKSSYKKVQKFLKSMEKEGLLKLKEQRGETMLSSIQWSHSSFTGLRSYKTYEQTPSPQSESNGTSAGTATTLSCVSPAEELIEIHDYYKPSNSAVIALFEAAKRQKDAMYTASEVKQTVLDYIKENALINLQNQKMITIDALLCDAVLNKSEYSIKALKRDEIQQRLLDAMTPFHRLVLPGKGPSMQKGHPKQVEITKEIRQGRKTVTKLTGVEHYGLDVEDLCKELTRLCASSATYNPLHGTQPKNPYYEIMVQGPQIKNVSELVLSKGIPKRCVFVNDKTATKGKGKK